MLPLQQFWTDEAVVLLLTCPFKSLQPFCGEPQQLAGMVNDQM